MSSRSLKLVVLLALVAGGVYACSGDLNPQPLPPADDDRKTGTPTANEGDNAPPGAFSGNPAATPSVNGDGGTSSDAGLDASDGGDAGDAG